MSQFVNQMIIKVSLTALGSKADDREQPIHFPALLFLSQCAAFVGHHVVGCSKVNTLVWQCFSIPEAEVSRRHSARANPHSTNFWAGVFDCFFLLKKASSGWFEDVLGRRAGWLRKFYQELKTKKGETYRRTSYWSVCQRFNGNCCTGWKRLLDLHSASFKRGFAGL